MTSNCKNFLARLTTVLMVVGLALSATVHATQTITYYHWDALGSPVAATDEAGNVKWREEYKPYGEKLQNQPQSQNNTRWYTGHPHDNATGLTYMGARYYDPVVGRFMGVDPKAFSEADPHSFNRYAYANDNPYKFFDPDGREAQTIGMSFKLNLTLVSRFMALPLDAAGGKGMGIAVSWPTDTPGDNGKWDIGVYTTNSKGAGISYASKSKLGGAASVDVSNNKGDVAGLGGKSKVRSWNLGFGGGSTSYDPKDNSVQGEGWQIGPGWDYGLYETETEVWSLRRGAARAIDAAIDGATNAASRALRGMLEPLPTTQQ